MKLRIEFILKDNVRANISTDKWPTREHAQYAIVEAMENKRAFCSVAPNDTMIINGAEILSANIMEL